MLFTRQRVYRGRNGRGGLLESMFAKSAAHAVFGTDGSVNTSSVARSSGSSLGLLCCGFV